MKFPLYNKQGEKIDEVKLEVSSEKAKLNKQLVSQVIRVEQNHTMTKNGRTKTKGEVSGGGRKPFKQKGTGRARAGSNRSPIWSGGGITFGPTGVSKVLAIPVKMKRLAMLQMLSFRAKDIAVIEAFEVKSNKTKDAAKILEKIAPAVGIAVISSTEEKLAIKPFENLPATEFYSTNNLHISDLMKKRLFLFSEKSFEEISQRVKNV